MLSSIFLSGRLGEVKDPVTRIVEIEHVIPGPSGHYGLTKLPVKAMAPDSPLIRAKSGAIIILKGRVQSDENGIIYVIDELDEIFSLPDGMKRV